MGATIGAYQPYGYAASGHYRADSVGAVHIAKREAEADAEAEADPFYRHGYSGLGYWPEELRRIRRIPWIRRIQPWILQHRTRLQPWLPWRTRIRIRPWLRILRLNQRSPKTSTIQLSPELASISALSYLTAGYYLATKESKLK